MTIITRILSAFALVTTLLTAPACMQDTSLGAYPQMDDEDAHATVSKDEALDVAVTALEGFNAGDYDAWTTRWHSSMLAGIPEQDWLAARGPFLEQFGEFEQVLETRLTHADADDAVRFSFLVEFEHAELMLIHVYPEDSEQIIGVFLANPDGSSL